MNNGLMTYIKLYGVFCKQYMKSLMQSKIDFFMGLFGFLCSQVSGLAFIYLIFRQIPVLKEWTFEQMIFIYGFSQIARGLDHLLTDNLWMVAWQMVIKGTFDRYMLRPINLLFQIICEKVQFDAIGELLIGTYIVVRAVRLEVVTFTFISVPVFVVSVLAGAVIYTSVKLFFSSLAFWVKESAPFLQTAYDTADFAKYPIEIYPKIVKTILVYILPFAFTAYIPATYFLGQDSFVCTVGLEIIVAAVAFMFSYFIFKKGVNRYESAGS